MKKKVTAPLSYDPGKGRPKEHLAYLNWQEMQQLQRLNGGNMEFGPRGLPSFPPADAKGSSSKASSSSKPSGGGGRDSGSRDKGGAGTYKGVSGKGSGASTSRSSGPSTRGPVSRIPSSPGRAAKPSGPASRGPVSKIPSYQAGVRSIPSLTKSVPSYGVLDGKTIRNVVATPYNTVFQDQVPVTGRVQDPVGDLRSSGKRLHSGYDFATDPGAPVYPRQPGKVIQVAVSRNKEGKPVGYGTTVQVLAADGTIDRYALHTPQKINLKPGDPVYQDTVIGRAGRLDPRNPAHFSHLHYEAITRKDKVYNKIINEMNSGRLAKNQSGVFGSTSNLIGTSREKALANPKTSTAEVMARMGLERGTPTVARSIYSPTAGQFAAAPRPERVVPVSAGVQPSGFSRMSPATQLALRGAVAAGKVLGSPADYKLPSISQASDFQKKILASLPPDARQKVVNQKLGEMATEFGQKLPSYLSAGMDTVRRGIAGLGSGRQAVQQASADSISAPAGTGEAQFQPYGMTVEQQKEFDKYSKRVGRTGQVAGVASNLVFPGLGFGVRMAGKAINKAAEAKINKYVASTPSERAEQERKDPSLIGWASALGIQPQNDYSVYQSWATERGLLGPGESRGGQPREEYAGGIGSLPSASVLLSTQPSTPSTAAPSGPRPYQYYQWDVGVNIPSPGDPDYTSYQEYLRRRAQAQA